MGICYFDQAGCLFNAQIEHVFVSPKVVYPCRNAHKSFLAPLLYIVNIYIREPICIVFIALLFLICVCWLKKITMICVAWWFCNGVSRILGCDNHRALVKLQSIQAYLVKVYIMYNLLSRRIELVLLLENRIQNKRVH